MDVNGNKSGSVDKPKEWSIEFEDLVKKTSEVLKNTFDQLTEEERIKRKLQNNLMKIYDEIEDEKENEKSEKEKKKGTEMEIE